MARFLSNTLSYLGVASATPPNFRIETRVPLVTDYKNFNLGYLWLQKAKEL